MSKTDEEKPPEKAIVFETIRLPSCYNVKTLNDKVLRSQHYKLSEKFRVKQRQLNQLEKRIEELENRHTSDDQLICALNRQWNLLDDMLMDLFRQQTNEDIVDGNSSNQRMEINYLTLISQLNSDEVTQKLESRVNFSNESFARLLRCINGISRRRDRILSLLSKKEKDACSVDDEDSQLTAETDTDRIGELDSLLRQELSEALAENKRLEVLTLKLTTEKTQLAHSLALQKDKLEVMESQVENAKNQFEDAKFEVAKAINKEEKLEGQIIELKRQLDKAKTAAVEEAAREKGEKSKAETSAGISETQLEELQGDIEIQTDLAEKRLAEIQQLTTQNQELAAKIVELNNAIKFLPTCVIQSSPDFICLRLRYTNLVDEAKRIDQENALLKGHIMELRTCYDAQVAELRNEFTIGMERLRENCTMMSSELLAVKKECSLMELEFKQKYESDAIEARNYKEMKRFLQSAKDEIRRKGEENLRLRNEIKKLKEHADGNKEVDSTDNIDIKPELKDVKTESLNANVEVHPEIEQYRKEIARLSQFNEKLKRQIDSYAHSERGLMSEIENTATAVEELMNQNTSLAERVSEQEETYIKMVKDGLQNETASRTLKQALEVLEQKVKIVESEREAMRFELQQHTEKAELCKQCTVTVEATLKKLNATYEATRRNLMNMNVELNELKIRYEKQSAEVQDLRQQLKERVAAIEGSRGKMNRLKEEKNILKKKLHRAKQAADCENFDELLMEENKMLRESLACPSCKTGDKNTVLTKCFHVFCMECVKKRYDGRSRKCPKCNAAFGANDFHRIYIE
ncbi:unnamed protein product [Bursaphelenchus xylophilus]|uniref:E3 ubiquitin protein ligase n=1 Tax=Bursaphelenchus xylophilus TaxID=6326 RepID=A0A1I7RPQ4_BURXY|nr:unnamed protein product [Bursaphelenchus xylophilus]CAG9096440.1 unnamed protein product [Bursaphelenchus xylophilus]